MDRVFIGFSADKLSQLAGRIETCLGKLTHEQIWWRGADESNAIGNLVLHLRGNLGQWILSAVGGAPDMRDRDGEFNAQDGPGTEELASLLRERVAGTVAVIRGLTAERLMEKVHVQKYDVTVLEAVYHVVEHIGQHAAQIMYATKMMARTDLGFYGHLKSPVHSETTP